MHKLKIIEFEGLAPSVFCGMYFADQGAEVVLVARAEPAPMSMPIHKNIMNRNKLCIQLNLKDKQHFQTVVELIKSADVVIDPYRPGVLEKLKLGPKQLYAINRRIILLRVSGYGQTGKLSLRPGHDLNYLSIGGILPLINKKGQYQFPSNILADFVASSLGVTGTLTALHQRQLTGQGQVVDCSLADGCTYLSQNIIAHQLLSQKKEGHNIGSIKIGDYEYVYTCQIQQNLSQNLLLKLLDGKEYFRNADGTVEISRVKKIPEFKAKAVSNPFASITAQQDKEIRIPMKGEHNSSLMQLTRPKL